MKNLLALITLLFVSASINAQNDVISIVEEGIFLHDAGYYDKAIETYERALEIEPNSPLVLYEIGLSHYTKEDYKEAIKYFDKVLNLDNLHLLPATINKGLSLDHLGKSKAAFKFFKKAAVEFSESAKIHYNLGYQYYIKEDLEKCIDHLSIAIALEPSYSTSHLLMGYVQNVSGNKVKSLLAYHYFLLLNPLSERTPDIFSDIETLMQAGVSNNQDKSNNISVNMSNFGKDFGTEELMLSLLAASKTLEENEGKTEEEMLIINTDKFFKFLGERKENEPEESGVYWEFYIPFFASLAESGHTEAYYYHITENLKESSATWIEKHTMKMFAFEKWLNK